MFVNRRGHDSRIFWPVGRAEAAVGSITTLDDRIVSQRDDHKHAVDRFLSNSISLSVLVYLAWQHKQTSGFFVIFLSLSVFSHLKKIQFWHCKLHLQRKIMC